MSVDRMIFGKGSFFIVCATVDKDFCPNALKGVLLKEEEAMKSKEAKETVFE